MVPVSSYLKDKSDNVNDIDNYRAITLLPVISKVMGVIFGLCDSVLDTDNR